MRALLTPLCPSAAEALPASYSTVRAWIMETWSVSKAQLIIRLQSAVSLIHYTVDIWTSPNGIPILGVIAHFVTKEMQLERQVMALRELEGPHTGENISAAFTHVITEYNVLPQTGYFNMDNATNNDTFLQHLTLPLRQADVPFERQHRRLRCIGHILNLSVKAFMFHGLPSLPVVNEHDFEYTPHDLDHNVREWRKRGPLGKAHNICIYIRKSPQR